MVGSGTRNAHPISAVVSPARVAERESDPGLQSQRRMTASEDQPQPVVWDIAVLAGGCQIARAVGMATRQQRSRLVQLGRLGGAAAQPVQGAVAGDGCQPRTRPLRYAIARPALHRLCKRILGTVLGDIPVTGHPDQRSHHTPPLLAERLADCGRLAAPWEGANVSAGPAGRGRRSLRACGRVRWQPLRPGRGGHAPSRHRADVHGPPAINGDAGGTLGQSVPRTVRIRARNQAARHPAAGPGAAGRKGLDVRPYQPACGGADLRRRRQRRRGRLDPGHAAAHPFSSRSPAGRHQRRSTRPCRTRRGSGITGWAGRTTMRSTARPVTSSVRSTRKSWTSPC